MSFIFQALQRLLDALWCSLGLSGKQGSLLLLGLDNAGKTTLLHRLRTGDIRSFPPTDRPHHVDAPFTFQGIQFQAWDLGGHEAVRHLWEDYVTEKVSAVLFLVDAADTERLEEAAYELDALIGEQMLADLPVAILLNKCDMPNAMPSTEVCERIEFKALQDMQGDTKLQIFRISVLKGEGYQEAFRWIGGFL
jgi:GTP-binding protein SAR1